VKPEKTSKVLVIRFNSIGDIVLTSPVVERLAKRGYEVHYLVKKAFAEIVENNPAITKVWQLENSLEAIIKQLKGEQYDYVVDLHNNIRSHRVHRALKARTYILEKHRIALWLLTTFGINTFKQKHIVHRFLEVIAPIRRHSKPANKPQFYIPENTTIENQLPEQFLAIAVGAAWKTKEIPIARLNEIIAASSWSNIVLLGGPTDENKVHQLESTNKNLINLVGQLSITQSAAVIKKASVLLTGDTGLMHIAAAVETAIVAVFGSTHPILGYTPFTDESAYELIQNTALSCRPCTKQGKKACPKGHFKCMLDLDYSAIIEKIDAYI